MPNSNIDKLIRAKEIQALDKIGSVLEGVQGLKGEKGSKGDKGDKGDRGPIGPQGERGPKGKDGKKGKDGRDGIDGETPIKGVDYLTQLEIQTIETNAALSAESQLFPQIEEVKAMIEEMATAEIDVSRIPNILDVLPKNPPLHGGGSGGTFIKSMRDLNSNDKQDGYAIVWDAATQKHKYAAAAGGSSVTFGTDGQIPYMNATDDDFNYESTFVYTQATNTLTVDEIDIYNPVTSSMIIGEFNGTYTSGGNSIFIGQGNGTGATIAGSGLNVVIGNNGLVGSTSFQQNTHVGYAPSMVGAQARNSTFGYSAKANSGITDAIAIGAFATATANNQLALGGDSGGAGNIDDARIGINSTSTDGMLRLQQGTGATLADYGSGSITGTAAYALAVTASGLVIEEAVGGGGHTIQEEGVNLTDRTNLNFIGPTVTAADDAGNNATTVTIDDDLSNYDNTTSGFITATDPTLQSVTDNGATTTNNITIDNGGLSSNDLNLNGSTHHTLRSTATDEFHILAGASERLAINSTGGLRVNNAFTLPTSDGTSNQVLQTNGSGVVSWATVSGGGSVNFGLATEIPFMNAGATDFDYASTFTFDDTTTPTLTVGDLDIFEIGTRNVQIVSGAGSTTLTGTDNFIIGTNGAGGALTSGDGNTLFGNGAGSALTSGDDNTLIGTNAGGGQTTNNGSVFVGKDSGAVGGFGNTLGIGNSSWGNSSGANFGVAIGNIAAQNATGSRLTTVGYQSGQSTTGADNSFFGYQAGRAITSGGNNCAFGSEALENGTSAVQNAAFGTNSMQNISTGDFNVGVGYNSLFAVGSGSDNTALGYTAGDAYIGDGSIFIGSGADAASTAKALDYMISIGLDAETTAAHQMVVGGTTGYINDIYFGASVTDAVQSTFGEVTLNASGTNGIDKAGVNLGIASGKGTGQGAGGDLVFYTANSQGTGSTLQSISEKARIYNTTGNFETGGGRIKNRTASAAGNYTVLVSDHIIGKTGITGGGDTVTLPSTAVEGQEFIIKDESGSAGTNNITVATAGSENIDGASTQTISTNYGSIHVYFDGSNYFII